MKGLAKRLGVSAILIVITCTTIFAVPGWVFFLVVNVFALLAYNEYLSLIEKKGVCIHRPLALSLGFLVPFFTKDSQQGAVLSVAFLAFFLTNFQASRKNQAFYSAALMSFGLVYVVCFFSFLIPMRFIDSTNFGAWWVFYTVLLVKTGDAGAYFIGSRFGKNKLIEHISPNKSVEGAWGGLIVTTLLSVCSKFFLPGNPPIIHLLVLGILVSLVSQLGDLVESLIKRDVGIKDSGVIPGLGGILDVLDSLILAIPLVYYYLVAIAVRNSHLL